MTTQTDAGSVADYTTIRVKPGTADELHDRKKRGDSYDDVIQRLLAETREGGE